MKKQQPRILVLGCRGMTGSVVFNYLRAKFPKTTYGTHHSKVHGNPNILKFRAEYFSKDIAIINKNKFDYIINCIGKLPNTQKTSDLILVNSMLPHLLAETFLLTTTKIIHISTDGVFGKKAGTVNEKVPPVPDDIYGKTKLLGEVTANNVLTIRTSLIGFASQRKTGLLEWIINSPEPTINGFTNQKWSGCTTYQFAKLCEFLIEKKYFSLIRAKTSVLHFAPLLATKYELIKKTIEIMNLPKKVKKVKSITINRSLISTYKNVIRECETSHILSSALSEASNSGKLTNGKYTKGKYEK